jgi:hypothetical protein
MFGNINIDIGPPTLRTNQHNVHINKRSTGKYLGSFFARKRHLRRQQVISSSNQLEIDNPIDGAPTKAPPSFHPMETYDSNFQPTDDPYCQDNTWYDAISP